MMNRLLPVMFKPLLPAFPVDEPPNPIHYVLTTCGITNARSPSTFINIEGLGLIEAFESIMSGDSDVTEMAKKRMASRPNAAAGRVIILGTLQIKKTPGSS